MSLIAVAARLKATADALRATDALLAQSGDLIVKEVKSNLDRGQVGGEFRPALDTSGAPAGGQMTPLATYTLDKRAQKGISHVDPLKETGGLYREIGTRGISKTRILIGGMTSRARKLLRRHMGTNISNEVSSDLQRPIPYRSPLGYSRRTLDLVLSLWDKALGVKDNTSGSANFEIRL